MANYWLIGYLILSLIVLGAELQKNGTTEAKKYVWWITLLNVILGWLIVFGIAGWKI